ncbi:MAG: 16S rRNA (adenine(1518)-N(6)/adenine(1519)-N(6))-dimethyltransferase RsmA [Pyramidobacter sp.]|uniref:16S rRNA (adenine(1518)-N(6)/adenine(1519)-N(6))- dimethyltransferase RsmA n=1 Tax=Pyramidobacter sp. TaxID=1943581 RepID=UPI002A7F7DF9|nr:16S rRNA (adenine(1518)-N(6)/adenine(1519)-N(6))-dimethyltransferase RsmA [Pyramidobacter sp.]MDY4033538.1 16S rRNA (adenine(1518)-N(6)/adenine(1519)-N(6))-dimethyltransferase RsmA [Pyramidobacter sp.]
MTHTFNNKISLGQNFLNNPAVTRRCLEAGALNPADVVLEVGPGQGALTRAILQSPCRFVHALEIDRRLAPWLEPLRTRHPDRFKISWGDVLSVDLRGLFPLPNKVLANIPYNITTDLIWKILAELGPNRLERLILLVQKEAADRLNAPPATKARSPLGITLEQMGAVRTLMKVSPGSFNPPPKVWSALISIALTKNFDLAASPLWRRLLAAAFAQRRKKLVNNLAAAGCDKSELPAIFAAAGIGLAARAEELTAPQWRALFQEFAAAGN